MMPGGKHPDQWININLSFLLKRVPFTQYDSHFTQLFIIVTQTIVYGQKNILAW